MIIVRQLREELTQALMEHLCHSARNRVRQNLAAIPYSETIIDGLIDSISIETWRQTAEDCMDFMYGEIEELYPDQPSCDGQSEGSAPVPDHQG